MKNIHTRIFSLLALVCVGAQTLCAQTDNLGEAIFTENFGTIPPTAEWAAENGDDVYFNTQTYRKADNSSTYTFLAYRRRADHTIRTLESAKPAIPVGGVGDWTINSITNNNVFNREPFKSYPNNPAYVWEYYSRVGFSEFSNRKTYEQYLADPSVYTDPCRWLNDGSWKLGWWQIVVKTDRGEWLDVGKYAVGANFYHIGEDDWENNPADRSGDVSGLSLMVHGVNGGGVFYVLPLTDMVPGYPYNLSLYVKNPDTNPKFGGTWLFGALVGAKDKVVPNLTLSVQGTTYTVSSGELPFVTPDWKEMTLDFVPTEGMNNVAVDFSLGGGGEDRGNSIAIDDITIKPYVFDAGGFTANVCAFGEVTLTSDAVSLSEDYPLYTRWMRRDKSTGLWQWLGDASADDAHRSKTIASDDFEKYDYRVAHSYSGLHLAGLTMAQAQAESVYHKVSEAIVGYAVPRIDLKTAVNACVEGADPVNDYTVTLSVKGTITSFTYKIGEDGEETPVLSPAEGDLVLANFMAYEGDSLYITQCEFGECATSPYRRFELPYTPKIAVTGVPSKMAVFSGDALSLSAVADGAFADVNFNWYDNQGCTGVPVAVGAALNVASLSSGTTYYYLLENGGTRCPFKKKVEVEVLSLPVFDNIANKNIKISEEFALSLTGLANIDHYCVVLKNTDMDGFVFLKNEGVLSVEDDGTATLKLKQGNSSLLASPQMVGKTFTFTLSFWQEHLIDGVVYSKIVTHDVNFMVIAAPGVYLAQPGTVCAGSTLTLIPMIGGDLSTIISYDWKVEGVSISSDPTLRLPPLTKADNNKAVSLTIVYTGGTSQSNTVNLHVVDVNADNAITTPFGVGLIRQRVTLAGTQPDVPEIRYQWQRQLSGSAWGDLPDQNKVLLDVTLMQPAKYRRVLTAGECSSTSNEVFIEPFDNTLNSIQYDENLTVAPGSSVSITGSAISLNDATATYQWQERETTGNWTNITGAIGKDLTFSVSATRFVRRLVSADACLNNASNTRLVSVSSSDNNTIYYKGSFSPVDAEIKIIGSESTLANSTYQWVKRSGAAASWLPIAGETSRNLTTVLSSSMQYARILSYTDGLGNNVTNESNVVQITAVDQSLNSISGPASMCRYNELDMSGSSLVYDGTGYQWQVSLDGQVWDFLGITTRDIKTEISQSAYYRRLFVVEGVSESPSNVLRVSAVEYKMDNYLEDAPVIPLNTAYTLEGPEVYGAEYRWQSSLEGRIWDDLSREKGFSLVVAASDVPLTKFYRRGVICASGCDGENTWSNAVKVIVSDVASLNHIDKINPVCPSSAFTVGRNEGDGIYSWKYSQDGTHWSTVSFATEATLRMDGGILVPTLFARELIRNGVRYRSNEILVHVYDLTNLVNRVEYNAYICQGQTIVLGAAQTETPVVNVLELPLGIKRHPAATDAFTNDAIASVYWQNSITGAVGTWKKIAEGYSITIEKVTDQFKYRRVLSLKNGLDNFSNETLPRVFFSPAINIYDNAPLDRLNVTKPIKISVTPDYYGTYEFEINGMITRSATPSIDFYNWRVQADNEVIVRITTEDGCLAEQRKILHGPDADLPNVITPNGDGINDVLLKGYSLSVFNRNGKLIYEGSDGWDGTEGGAAVTAGTYFYTVVIPMGNEQMKEYKRTVTVVR